MLIFIIDPFFFKIILESILSTILQLKKDGLEYYIIISQYFIGYPDMIGENSGKYFFKIYFFSFFPLQIWIIHLKGDIIAGLTVAVMLVPQGMAYAGIAGLPPIYGLYSSTIPMFVYVFFGTSRQLSVAPVAIV